KRAYCLKIQPATGSFARNLIYSTKPPTSTIATQIAFKNSRKTLFSGSNLVTAASDGWDDRCHFALS
ncbi:hypothetical protein RAG82_12735, partial [Klebsiella pneumoniae]